MNEEEIARLQSFIDRFLEERDGIRVLEAGCGSTTRLDLGGKAYLVGLDMSERQLERNRSLDERILGDIEVQDLPPQSFDMIVCWNVLEHVPHPDRAIANFRLALKDDGLIVLAVPNPLSVKGLVTKFTPYRFHVWVHRTLLGRKTAGTDGQGPFPTFMRMSLAPEALKRTAASQGLQVAYLRLYEGNQQRRIRRKLRLEGGRWRGAKSVVRALTLGKVSPDLTDCFMVLTKGSRPTGRPPSRA